MLTDTWTHVTIPDKEGRTFQEYQERTMWLIQTFGPEAQWEDIDLDDDRGRRWARWETFFWFREERDAVLFMLRWS
jgi:hypothetical protein